VAIPPATAAVAATAAAPTAVRLIAFRTFPSPLLLAVLRLALVAAFEGAFFEAVRLAEEDAALREVAVRFAGDFVVRVVLAFFRGVLLLAGLLLVRAAVVEALFLAGDRREVALFAVERVAVERAALFAAAFRPLVAARLVDFFAGEVLRVEEAFFVLDFLAAVDFVLVDFFAPVDLVAVDFFVLDFRPAVDFVLVDFFVPLELAVADFFEPLADFFELADFALLFPLDAEALLRLRDFEPDFVEAADERSISFEKRLPLSS
jgi:hypothetical protein